MEGQDKRVNNAFYEDLGDAWYEDAVHPIALLRAENATRNPWILEKIRALLGPSSQDVLDIGCGAGFLSNALGADGHRVTGIDLSGKSLEVAAKRDSTKTVRYMKLDAFALPFPDHSFNVISAMDFLEHVDTPERIVQEAARLLRPNGLFFFHTFNRNWLSFMMVIKAVEWFVPNTPANMHIYSNFIKPQELQGWCNASELALLEMRGLVPRIASMAFLKSLLTRKVHKDFQFRFTDSQRSGYLGIAQSKQV